MDYMELNEVTHEVKYLRTFWGSYSSVAMYFISFGMGRFFHVASCFWRSESIVVLFKRWELKRPVTSATSHQTVIFRHRHKCVPVPKHDTLKACANCGCELIYGFIDDSICCCTFQPAVCEKMPRYGLIRSFCDVVQAYWRLLTLLAASVCRNTDVQRTIRVCCQIVV
jgi:hypothetical protein